VRISILIFFCCFIAFPIEAKVQENKQSKFIQFIFQKMDYDKMYFESVIKLKNKGKTSPKLTSKQFAFEVDRASFNLPVLKRFQKEKPAFLKGTPFTLPPIKESYRVYINLLSMLNMFQSFEKKDYATAIKYGEYVVVQKKESVGLTTEKNTADYYVKLFREYYFIMAACNYYLKDDTKAVKWFAGIEADADLKKLKAQISQEKKRKSDSRELRLEELRTKPLAIMDMLNADNDPENDWMTHGITEILTNELVQNTDILIVERSQLKKIYKEFELALQGVTVEENAMKIGEVLNAESLLISSFQKSVNDTFFTFRIVDAKNGQVLESVSGKVAEDEDLFKNIRVIVLELFVKAGWIFPEAAAEVNLSHAPKLKNIRQLIDAKLSMTTRSDEARSLYAEAMKEDPALAGLFEELKTEFKDISATVAVIPFVNVTGNGDDKWMINAIVEAMSNDLPKLNFTVVERTQFLNLLKEKVGQVVFNEDAIKAGKSAGADFLMMGSLFHHRSLLKLNARFVEISTGIVLFSAEADNTEDDLNKALVDLVKNIAENLNRKLSQETIAQLASKKISRSDFKKFTRQQLAKDSMKMADEKKKQERAKNEIANGSGNLPRWPFWTAVGTFSLGLATTVSQFIMLNNDTNNDEVKLRTALGWTGFGLAVLSAGYMIFDSAWQTKLIKEERKKRIQIMPEVTAGKGKGAKITVSGSF